METEPEPTSHPRAWPWRARLRQRLRALSPAPNLQRMGDNVRADITAGVTVAVISLPIALAFGVASGLGPAAGIWGAICGGIIGSLFGGSSVGISGPTGPKVVQLAAIMVAFRLADGSLDVAFAFGVVFLSGIFLIALSALRVGRLVYYTPYPMVAGFMCGVGVIVLILEVDPLLGLPSSASVGDALLAIPQAITHARPDALLVSIPTLVVIFSWAYFTRLNRAVPAPLAALVIGTLIANALQLDVARIGEIPTGLPSLHLPPLDRLGAMLSPALSLTGLAIFDSLLTCLVNDHLLDERHDSDREIFAQGLSNISAGLLGGLTSATATMRSVTAIKTGGRTPLVSLTYGVVLLVLALGLAPLAASIPLACLAAILIKVAADIIDFRVLPHLKRLPRADLLIFWAMLALTVLVDPRAALIVGLIVAFARYMQQMNPDHPRRLTTLGSLERDGHSPGDAVTLLTLEGPLYFNVVLPIEQAYRRAPLHRVLLIDMSRVLVAEPTGAHALARLLDDAHLRGVEVVIAATHPRVRAMLARLPAVARLGPARLVHDLDAAHTLARALDLPTPLPLLPAPIP